jgi:hypothetical protein
MPGVQLHWWDDDHADATRGGVVPAARQTPSDAVTRAIDALALAAMRQSVAGANASTAGRLTQWCLQLKQARSDLATALRVRDDVDRLERPCCEPTIWHHLGIAEQALTAHIALLRQG